MLKSICLLFVVCVLFATFHEHSGNPVNNFAEVDLEDFKNFIKEIKENVNLNVNPCEDFEKYACGNLDALSKQSLAKNLIYYTEDIIKNHLTKPKTDLEKQILNYYKKCTEDFNKETNEIVLHVLENIDVFQEAQSLPSKKDYSPKEIVKLATRGFTIINFETKITFGENENTRILNLKGKFYPVDFKEEYYRTLMKIAGSKDQDAENVIKDIDSFIKKLNQIYESNIAKTPNESFEEKFLESFDEFKNEFPSKNWDWDELSNSAKKLLNPKLKYKILVKNVKLVTDFLELIDSTNLKVVANFFLLENLTNLINVKCGMAEQFFSFAITSHIWKEFFTDKVINHYTNFFNKFEMQFNETIKENDDIGFYKDEKTLNSITYNALKSYQNIVENHMKIYSPEILDNIYDHFDFNTTNIYQNVFNTMINIFKITWKLGGYDPEPTIYKEIFNLNYDEDFDYDKGMNYPLFYYDTVLSFNFWLKYYGKNRYVIYKLEEKPCVKNFISHDDAGRANEEEIYFLLTFLKTLKSTYKNMSNYTRQMQNIGEDAAWTTSNKLFYISIAQRMCYHKDFFTALTFSPEFIKTFGCSSINTTFNEFNNCYRN